MFGKLYLVFFAIAAVAVAQDRYYIRNGNSGLVLDVSGSSAEPGAGVILWTRNDPPSNNRLWTFEAGGVRNVNSGLFIEAPLNDNGQLVPGTPLHQASQTFAQNQQWNRDSHFRLFSIYDTNLVIAGQNGDVQDPGTRAVADPKLDPDDDHTQDWLFDLFQG